MAAAVIGLLAIGGWYVLGGGREGEFFDPGVLLIFGSAAILTSATVAALFVACFQTRSVKRRFALVFVSGYLDPLSLSAVVLVLRGGGSQFALSLGWLMANIVAFRIYCGKQSRDAGS